MLVLGIDPGTALCGYGLVRAEGDDMSLVAYGAVSTSARLPLAERLLQIHRELGALIATHHPKAAAVEKLFFSKNTRTAMTVGHARGVVLLSAAEAGLAVYEYTPNEVKQAVVGYGGADKNQMQQMVRMLLHLDFIPEPDDAADAVAIAICHIQSSHLREMIEAQE
ncbi:MAG: crossover junction endodeoxyribonuclease RuvC [Anaerolineae bacterium]